MSVSESESNSNSRTQILIAVIGLAGVLGTAVFANWDKIFPKSDKPSAISAANLSEDRKSGKNSADPGKSRGETGKNSGNGSSAPESVKTYSIHGRLLDRATGMPLDTAQILLEIGNDHEKQDVDNLGRYLFYIEGFSPDDVVTFRVRSPNHRACRMAMQLSQIASPKNLFLPPAASAGAATGGVSGGGKGAAIGAVIGAAQGGAECPEGTASSAPYRPRSDGLPIKKSS